MRIKWPKEMPVLSARDMCRARYNGPDGRHCLLGHVYCSALSEPMLIKMRAALSRECGLWPSDFNDDPSNSLAKLAQVWNRAIARLGYVVGNPEAKHVKRKK